MASRGARDLVFFIFQKFNVDFENQRKEDQGRSIFFAYFHLWAQCVYMCILMSDCQFGYLRAPIGSDRRVRSYLTLLYNALSLMLLGWN